MPYKNGIITELEKGTPNNIIARKIFLSYPTSVFIGNEDIGFNICNEISEYFNIPIVNIQVVGSSKIGYSYINSKPFIPGKSDLDIAIVDLQLFNKYLEIVHSITNGYTDLTNFKIDENGKSDYYYFSKCIVKGMFRPDLMPYHKIKLEWKDFFRTLSSKYFRLFKNINAGVYSSQYFFEQKQAGLIGKFKEHKGELK